MASSYGKQMLEAALKNNATTMPPKEKASSYGKQMLEAALKNNATTMPPKEKVDKKKNVMSWLSMYPQTENDDDQDTGDEELDQSSGSEYKPSASSSSSESHPSIPPFEDVQHSDVVAPSEASNESNSVVYPMLTNNEEDKTDADTMATPTQSQIRKAFEKVTVAGDPKPGGKRNYRKPDYCLFCKGRYMSKISAHYLSVHSSETKVKDIIQLPPGSQERKRLLALLQNEGNHNHNCEVLQNGFGEITVNRRPADKDSSKAELYVPCCGCKAWIYEKSLSTHSKTCPFGPGEDINFLRNSRMLLSPFLVFDSDEIDIDETIHRMKETSKYPGLRNICMHDLLIKEFCRGLLHKLGTVDEQRRKDKDNIRSKLRAVGRLLMTLNKNLGQTYSLTQYITPKHFMLIVNTVKEMGKCSPNMALTLGHYLKQICQLKQSLALQSGDETAKLESDNFNLLFGAHWNNYVSAVALRRLKLRTLNKSVELPKTSDMVKLKEFLDKEISSSFSVPRLSYQKWSETAQSLMVRILLFNKRRVAEVEEMKVSDILQAQKGSENEEILSQMDVTEKALARRMTVIEVRGKSTRGLRKVFVILSQQMLEACQHLIETRMSVGIEPSNDYLFARLNGTALDGCKAMRDVTTRCPDLECPSLIRTRLLRKYLATTIQLLDMTGDELKMVADHMGHSVSIHTDVYRLQTSLLEKTKVARALIALENGQLNRFSGRNLSACTFEELPLPLVEEDTNINAVIDDALCTVHDDNNSDENAEFTMQREEDDSVVPTENTEKGFKRKRMEEDEGRPIAIKQKKNRIRKRWNDEEEACLLEAFKEHIIQKHNPSGLEIHKAQEKYCCLKERSVAVIKSKVNNIILGKCKIGLPK